MPDLMLPPTFGALLGAFADCFGAPSFRNFCWVITGWVHCLGRRTITAIALASGGLTERHISVFHRFFARAQWSLDAVGHVLFGLALRWAPADQPLIVVGDDTLARKHGKCVALASMHHDPLLSAERKPFFSFGHVWVVLALWVPLPMDRTRGFALPLLFRLYTSPKRGGRADAPSRPSRAVSARRAAAAATGDGRTKPELLRDLVALVANWAEGRPVYLAADSLYAGRTLLEGRPANVQVVSRLRPDAALWTLPPPRRPGQRGRPRTRGERLPSPKAMAAARQHWHRLAVTIYGRTVGTQVARCTALWYTALRDRPVRIVLVRDPGGRRTDEAFFCTDTRADARFILQTYAKRWTLEVAFHDCKQALGFEDPQNQAVAAVRRTAPIGAIAYALVLLWTAQRLQEQPQLTWPARPWYRQKTSLSFLDMLTMLRRESWHQSFAQPSSPPRGHQNPAPPWPEAWLLTA